MLIDRVYKRGLSILSTLVIALLAIAVFPETGNAHGTPDSIVISAENAEYVDAGYVNEPSYASNHCHSTSGQDCSTQIAFLIASGILATNISLDASVPLYDPLSTGWSLSFDPPPPRVLS